MFKLFSNASIYRFTRTTQNLNVAGLNAAMPDYPFCMCTSQESARTGWEMNDDNTPWMLTFKDYILIRFRTERRDVPKAAIAAELDKRCAAWEERMGVQPKRGERLALRDEVYQKLLPRAFSKTTTHQMMIDLKRQLIIIDTASARQAEHALAFLRKTLQSLPVVPVCAKEPPELTMTEWLRLPPDEQPQGLTIDDSRLVVSNMLETSIKATLSGLTYSDATSSLLTNNNVVTTLSLTVATPFNLSFILTDTLIFRRLKFASALKEQAQENGEETAGEEDDRAAVQRVVDEATFILMAEELATAWDTVIGALGGEADL
ncbi:TPA: hypothetical protein JD836_14745 [Citrobacter freundii]|nr:hypothetical protein [Citrobacter freundii]HCD1268058.1 recombination-associated protein RdgC [Citrobacter freundii]